MRQKKVIWMLLGIITIFYIQAFGGQNGNGGGAWVCKDLHGLSSEIVDLTELRENRYIGIEVFPGNYRDIVKAVEKKLIDSGIDNLRSSPDGKLFSSYVDRLHYLHKSDHIIYTNDALPIINDALYFATPKTGWCATGMLGYAQVVNYMDDNHIIVQAQLFNSLNDYSKAALVIHEAAYAFFRENKRDTDSVRTRIVVGLGFSSYSADNIKFELLHMMDNITGNFLFPGSNQIVVQKVSSDGLLKPMSGFDISIHANKIFQCGNINSDQLQKTYNVTTDSSGIGVISIPDKECDFDVRIGIKINGHNYEALLPNPGWAAKLESKFIATDGLFCEVIAPDMNIKNKVFIVCAR